MFSEQGPMFIYNQDRDLQGYLCFKENEKVYDELKQQIRSKGFGGLQNHYSAGLKGYFRTIVNNEKDPEGMRLKLNTYRMQVVETW